tara:strand:+ start:85 stop:339 length:255 start_codon:yes stop_codon:yes gene_type:complete
MPYTLASLSSMPPPSMTHAYKSPVSRRSSCSRSSATDRQTLKRRSERRSKRRDLMHARCITPARGMSGTARAPLAMKFGEITDN